MSVILIDECSASSSEDEAKHEVVNIKTWLKRKDVIQTISVKEVSFKDGRMHPR